jgi:lipoate-protein ligase A
MSRADIVRAFVDSFGRQHDLRRSTVRADEAAYAARLVESKFATPEWIQRIP